MNRLSKIDRPERRRLESWSTKVSRAKKPLFYSVLRVQVWINGAKLMTKMALTHYRISKQVVLLRNPAMWLHSCCFSLFN